MSPWGGSVFSVTIVSDDDAIFSFAHCGLVQRPHYEQS